MPGLDEPEPGPSPGTPEPNRGRPEIERAAVRLANLVELDVLAARAAAEVQRLLADHLICVTLASEEDVAPPPGGPWLVVGGASGYRGGDLTGLRIAPGRGVGGLSASTGRVISVREYREEQAAADFRHLIADREGVHGAAGVPLVADGQVSGILFAGRREPGRLGDQELDVLLEFSHHLAAMVDRARQIQRLLNLARAQERERVARILHDDVTQLLFGVGSSARRARRTIGPEHGGADHELERIEWLASSAATQVRSTLRALRPIAGHQRLPMLVRAAVDAVSDGTGLAVELALLGPVPEVDPDAGRALVAVVREALANVARHGGGASALVSLSAEDHSVSAVVQDDGPGLPAGFRLRPAGGEGTGLASVAFVLDSVGGRLVVNSNDDGGVTVRGTVPRPRKGT